VFLHAFCNIWVLCEDTGATTCRVQLWRLHEFRFYSNWSTELFFFMFSPRFGFSGNIQVSQWIDNNCDGFKSSSLAPKEDNRTISLCFSSCFFVHWEVTGVSCIKYIGECFASTHSEVIGVREFFFMFSACFGFSRKTQVHGMNTVVKFAWIQV
jgi:hypothetical protein